MPKLKPTAAELKRTSNPMAFDTYVQEMQRHIRTLDETQPEYSVTAQIDRELQLPTNWQQYMDWAERYYNDPTAEEDYVNYDRERDTYAQAEASLEADAVSLRSMLKGAKYELAGAPEAAAIGLPDPRELPDGYTFFGCQDGGARATIAMKPLT